MNWTIHFKKLIIPSNYDCKKLGEELKIQLDKGYDIVRISKWSYTIFMENRRELNKELTRILNFLFTMEDDPQFEFTYDELKQLAQCLIQNDINAVKKIIPDL